MPRASADLHPLLVTGRSGEPCGADSVLTSAPLAMHATLTSPARPRSYAAVAMLPSYTTTTPCKKAHSSTTKPPIPFFELSRRCFRCLALDHRVRACRNPVRCRLCCRFGHRARGCSSVRMADFIPIEEPMPLPLPLLEPIPAPALAEESEEDPEELVFDSDPSDGMDVSVHSAAGGSNFLPSEEELEEEEDVNSDSDEEEAHVNLDPPVSRPACISVFMPYVPLEQFSNLAYATVDPPAMSPVTLVHHALQRRVHNPPTPVISASHGAGLVVFASHMERELAVAHSPFPDPHHQVSFIRHDDTDNRFIYNHSDFAALSIEDYPMEHWNPYHIFHTAVSFANPCEINPICLSGVDYQSVLLTVKTAGLSAIPHSIAVVGFSGLATLATVSIIDARPIPADGQGGPPAPPPGPQFEDGSDDILADFPQPSLQPHLPPAGQPDPSFQDRVVQMPGGNLMWGAFQPFVRADPILDKPAAVDVQVFPGFFEIHVSGVNGEKGFYRIPMLPQNDRMLVANFISCSIGFLKKVVVSGERHAPTLEIDVVCRDPAMAASLADVDDRSELVIGRPMLSLPAATMLADANAIPSPPRRSPRLKGLEPSKHQTILDRAILRKGKAVDGLGMGRRPKGRALPAKELLSLTAEAQEHLPPSSFLPPSTRDFSFVPSVGSAGGLVTAWNDNLFLCPSSVPRTFSLTSVFQSRISEHNFTVTNVYGPCDSDLKQAFLDELFSIGQSVAGPWLVFGDFNMILSPSDRSNSNFNGAEADRFNQMIDSLSLIEIPLLDRLFTWSNNRIAPTLCRLDRAFVSIDWNLVFPNTSLGSRTRSVSDHVPLCLSVATNVPYPSVFRLNNHVLSIPVFKDIVRRIWLSLGHAHDNLGPAGRLSLRLKRVRATAKTWNKEARSPLLLAKNCDTPAIVLKLDFQKAFDSISWDALDKILLAKGLPPLWCFWIKNLNSSSQSAVLLNGKPGRWFQCRRGLRQGDPLSPYLFNIVADILRLLILQASDNGLLLHPLVDDLACPVLQYADDTIIILRATQDCISNLMPVLHAFSDATGLQINYHKSTFAPIHVELNIAQAMALDLGCPVASFPQTYLGLPLSTHKLKLSAFRPYLEKLRNRLPGWVGKATPISGRAILVKASLRSMASHLLSAIIVPAGTILALDKICRAFFWAGDDHVTGGQCKVAWDELCAPVSKGGLGFRCLRTHNQALLMKFLSKLHSDSSLPWAQWLRRRYGWSQNRDLGDTHYLDSVVWQDLLSCLPSFRCLTKVAIGSGTATSFWHDLWIDDLTLDIRFPALYSHITNKNCSVAFCCHSTSVLLDTFPRLSHAASLELSDLQALVASVNLNDSVPDVRVARSDGRPLTTKTAYLAAFDHLQEVPFATTTWKNFATNRCRIFLWLADRDRLFTNERRFRRGIASSDSCPFCSSMESSVHLLLHCPSVLPFWIAVPALHDDVMSCFSLRDLWDGSSACQVRTSEVG
uniref:Uncharacterized protein n=1 Tax=Avena sativa TaxID=4498 RepID=A0ACD5XYD0_AVESA